MGNLRADVMADPVGVDGSELTALLVDGLDESAILTLDLTGCVVTWNAGAMRMLGYAPEEIIGRHFSVLHPVETVPAGRPDALMAAARAAGRAEERAWRLRKDGTLFWASVVMSVLRDATGALRGYGEVTRDVSEMRRVAIAHQATEDRFGLAFEHAPIGISITGLNGSQRGTFVEMNPAFAHMLGYEPSELTGTLVVDFTHPADVEPTRRALAGLQAGQPVHFEKRFIHRDGREVWTLVSSTPMPDPLGRGSLYAISQVMDISERRQMEIQLRQLADHDALTGLFNRHRFESELRRVTEEVARYGREAALLVLDLDGFKYVNDRFGHPAGDELVTRIAGLLTQTVRNSDIVARLGGDEFAVILPEASIDDAEQLADRILAGIRERGNVTIAQQHARITASIGVTAFDARTGLTGPELVVEADIAMYDAKAKGRDCRERFERKLEPHANVAMRHSWLERLRTAVEEDLFVLHAQPIPGICADDIPGFELLLRLPNDDGELIYPNAFLYHAERFNLIGEIDRLVLRRAATLLERHARAGNDISLSVNLSGRTMNDADLPADLAAILEAHPIPAGRLVIEVTETAAIVNIDRARELAGELRALGCLFALDDFGSGFASFYYLKHLDFDFLKIDGEFIRTLPSTPADQLVVQAVVDIARGLDTQTVAEFVEDEATVELLRTLGVDYGQGYHLGRPGPLEVVLPALGTPGSRP